MNRIELKRLKKEDATVISSAFDEMGWNKPVEQYIRYFEEQSQQLREVIVAWKGSAFCGYVTINWNPHYKQFKTLQIPEIQDFNVLLKFRRQGVGTQLMDRAEEMVAARFPVVGIGVGLYDGYNAAQRLYALRGYVPNGLGVESHGKPLKYGDQITVDDSLILYFTKSLN